MKLHWGLLSLCVLGLSACSTNTYDTEALNFQKSGENYKLIADENAENYNQLITDLTDLDIELNADTEVAVLATSTANIVDKLGMNVTAVTESTSLNENLQDGLATEEIISLGSALDPNLENLYQADADLVLVGSNMPHVDKYSDLENLVILPQEKYSDIFYTVYGLLDTFNLGDEAQTTFNDMVELDQAAKANVTDSELGDVAILKYAYGNVTIAPDNTYAGSLLTELDIDNMYGDLKEVDIPMDLEKLLSDDPDIIILYGKGEDMQEQLAKVQSNENLENLTAYQNDHIYILQSESLNADIDSAQTLLTLSEDIYGQ